MMIMLPKLYIILTLCLIVTFCSAATAVPSELQVRIKNDRGDSLKIKVHCRAGEQSLGTQTIVKGMAIEWKVEPISSNVKSRSPHLCDVEWNKNEGFHFEALSDASSIKDQKCLSFCSWHITENGPLLQNQKTGVWEAMPYRQLPGGRAEAGRLAGLNQTYYHINHLKHKCICYPPVN